MAQHDMVLDNAPGLGVRTDMNAALAALVSQNSGPVEPTNKFPGMIWLDTSITPNGLLKQRNLANDNWIPMPISATGIGQDIHDATAKTVLADADEFPIANSASTPAWMVAKITWANLKAAFSGLYQTASAALTSWAAVVRAAGFDSFADNPTSANLRGLMIDETGTGLAYFQNGDLGTPTAGNAANLTGLPYGGLLAAAIATAAEYLANTANKLASVNALWAAAVPVTIADTTIISTVSLATFIDSETSLTANRTIAAPTNVKNGQKGVMWFTSSGATRTLTLNAAYLLMTGVEVGPYSITTAQLLGLAYVCRGGNVYITSVLRRG
jgi:hypothetical protein